MNDYLMDRRRNSMPPHVSAAFVLLAFAFPVGLYFGVVLFGTREGLPKTTVVCPAPGTELVAAWPKECPREAVTP